MKQITMPSFNAVAVCDITIAEMKEARDWLRRNKKQLVDSDIVEYIAQRRESIRIHGIFKPDQMIKVGRFLCAA